MRFHRTATSPFELVVIEHCPFGRAPAGHGNTHVVKFPIPTCLAYIPHMRDLHF